MEIQQILAAGAGRTSTSNTAKGDAAGALTGGDFAKALASLSPQAGTQVAPGGGGAGQAQSASPGLRHVVSGEGGAPSDRLRALLASAAEGEDVSTELEALLSSEAGGEDLTRALEALLSSSTGGAGGDMPAALGPLRDAAQGDQDAQEALRALLASVAEGKEPAVALQELQAAADASDGATSPELAAALQAVMAQLAPGQHQGSGQARTANATPAGAPASLPGLAPGMAGQSTNPLLEAAKARADGSPNAPTSAALAAAEAVRQAAQPAAATTSPQAMIEALAARQQGQGGTGQETPPLAGGGALGGQGTLFSMTSSASTPSATGGATAQQASLNAPVGSQAWPRQLGQQLLQFARQGGEQRIEMKLHPAELGPLTVTLKVGDQGAQAHFLSAHAQVRQTLEQAIPQLREALADQGIALGETSVGEQRHPGTEGEGRRFADAANGMSGGEGDAPAEDLAPAVAPSNMTLDGRVDLYA